jgi:hypothetical protein
MRTGVKLCGKVTIGSRYRVQFHCSLAREATEAFLCDIDGKTNAGWKYRGTQLKVIVRQKADLAGL